MKPFSALAVSRIKLGGKMTYNYNITRYRSIKDTRLWTDRIFLAILVLSTLGFVIYHTTIESILVALPALGGLAAVALLFSSRQKIPFVDISNGTLRYYDSNKGQIVTIEVQDITHVSTRFCLLNIHTQSDTHTLNLEMIRNEKRRWEIKEMIREVVSGKL